jgi:hypothetical protein
MFSIVLAIGTISVIWVNIFYTAKEKCATITEQIELLDIVITVILILYIASFLFIRKNYVLKEVFEKSFWKGLRIKPILMPVCVIIAIFALVVWFFYSESGDGERFFTNPGGVFTLVMGFATAIGTYLAIKSIVEMKHTITSYPQLMESITKLLANTPSKEIRIVSYFILPGYWQVVSESKRENFVRALETARHKIKIACLEPKEHLSIVIDLAKRGTPVYPAGKATAKEIIEFNKHCEDILATFNNPKRLRWEKLPYYFFFVTEERAIIVTPVKLPRIKREKILDKIEDDKKDNIDHINYVLSTLRHNPSQKTDGKVDTLGFETSDQRIIETLWILFDKYYSENGVDVQTPIYTTSSIIPTNPPAGTLPSTNGDVNVEVNKSLNNTDILIEMSKKIKVSVKVQE